MTFIGSRYIAQALKVNKTLRVLSLKLNRIEDKAGSKLCNDLMTSKNVIEELNLSGNSLGHLFCESLTTLLLQNKCIRKLDISCNFIDKKNAATLKDSLSNNTTITELDIRNNKIEDGTMIVLSLTMHRARRG